MYIWQIDLSCQTHQYNTHPDQQVLEPLPLISYKQQHVHDLHWHGKIKTYGSGECSQESYMYKVHALNNMHNHYCELFMCSNGFIILA